MQPANLFEVRWAWYYKMKSGMFFVTDLVGMEISLKYLRIELNVVCYM